MRTEFLKNRFTKLQEELNQLETELDKSLSVSNKEFSLENYRAIADKIRTLEKERQDVKKREKLKRINEQDAKQREIVKELFNLPLPSEDIITQDGKAHATRVKKYKDLEAFIKKHKYAKFYHSERVHQKGLYTAIRVNGRKYSIKKLNEDSTEFIPFDTLEECIKYNGIRLKPMTFKKFKSLETKILKEGKKIEKQIKDYRETLKKLDVIWLENEHFISSQRPERVSIYTETYLR